MERVLSYIYLRVESVLLLLPEYLLNKHPYFYQSTEFEYFCHLRLERSSSHLNLCYSSFSSQSHNNFRMLCGRLTQSEAGIRDRRPWGGGLNPPQSSTLEDRANNSFAQHQANYTLLAQLCHSMCDPYAPCP